MAASKPSTLPFTTKRTPSPLLSSSPIRPPRSPSTVPAPVSTRVVSRSWVPPSPASLGEPRSRRRPAPYSPWRLLRSPSFCFFLGALASQISSLSILRHPTLDQQPFYTLFFHSPHSSKSPKYPKPSNSSAHSSTGSVAMAEVRPKFVLFGDSLTQHSFGEGGWGAALQNRYARKVDVVLRGYSGYNTRWALFLLPKLFPVPEKAKETKEGAEIRKAADSSSAAATLVTIFFGANDAALPDRQSKKQHVPVAEFKDNLIKIGKHIMASTESVKLIFITPPPVDEPGRLQFARATYKENAVSVPERLNDVTGQYATACKEAAAALGFPSVDLWTNIQKRPGWQTLFSDGLHFTAAGNKVVFEEVEATIVQNFPFIAWDKIPWDFPEHVEIDGANPQLAFEQHSS